MTGTGASETLPPRGLGGQESFFYRIHEELFGGPAVLCVSARIEGPLDIQLVKHACHHLQGRHPALRARIAAGDAGPLFVFDVPYRDIPVHSFFELGRTDLRVVVAREVDTPFDVSKCLWRVLLITDRAELERHYLLLSLHHSICDGRSAVRLAGEMIGYCASIFAGEAVHVDPLPLRPPLEELIRSPAQAALKTSGTSGPGDDGADAENVMPFHEVQPPGKRHTRFRVHALRTGGSAALLERCRRENVTVAAALAAVGLMTMSRHFGGLRVRMDASASITGSPGLEIGDEELWCRETLTGLDYEDTEGRGLWELARDCDGRLAGASSDNAYLFADTARDPAEDIERLRRARHFPVSCLLIQAGHIGPGQRGPFTTGSIALISGRQAAEHIMVISTATVGDALFLTFAHTSPLIRESWADRFVSDFLHLLERTVKQESRE